MNGPEKYNAAWKSLEFAERKARPARRLALIAMICTSLGLALNVVGAAMRYSGRKQVLRDVSHVLQAIGDGGVASP